MYNFDYEVCAVFVTLIILVISFVGRGRRSVQFKIYVVMVLSLLIASASDVVSAYCSNNMERFPLWIVYASNYVYFIFKIIMAILFCIYNIESTERIYRNNRNMWGLLFIPAIIELVLLAVNPFNHIIFSIDKNDGYVRGNLIWLIYAIGFFYLVFTVVYVEIFRKVIGKFVVHCVELFALVAVVHILVQYNYQHILIESFGESLCFLMIYFSIQKPEDLMDGRVATYNRKAFMRKAKLYFEIKIPFYIISISIEDYDYLEKTFGIETMSNFEVKLAEYLNNKAKKFAVYRVSDYMFYLEARDITNEETRKLAYEICNECDREWKIGEMEIPAVMDINVINCLEDVSDMNELFACASYFANEDHGKETRVVFAGDSAYFKGRRKSKIKLAIHKAIKNNAFQVYFQPIYSNTDKRINSAEALVRLNDDEMGFISPEEFIPIAEEDGSIIKIDDYVLEEVCKFVKNNDLKSKGIEYIEVNVSVIECMKHDMAKRVHDKIKKYGLQPGQINLEITETATVNSPQMLGINMNSLVGKGVQFSLDDYGTGYSNINYLINLPFYLIKIDKNIVWSSFKNEKAGIALDSSIQMIKKLGFHIVAEGIETLEQAEKLSEMGCEYLQGYYYSKPLTKDKFLEFLND